MPRRIRLLRFLQPVYTELQIMLQLVYPDITAAAPGTVLTTSAEALLTTEFALDVQKTHSSPKVQSILVKCLSESARLALRLSCTRNRICDSLSLEDSTYILGLTSKSQISRVFHVGTRRPNSRPENHAFVAFFLRFRNLPQPLYTGSGFTPEGTDSVVEPCNGCHGKHLDVTGAHAAACKSAKGQTCAKHAAFIGVFQWAAGIAGIRFSGPEPSTADLLLNEFTPYQTGKLFPRKASRTVIQSQQNSTSS